MPRRALAALLLVALVAGCGDDGATTPSSSGSAPAGPQAGYATGKITMADGAPIPMPGAVLTVSISGVSAAAEKVGYTPVIKPDGTYRQKLADGAYTFSGPHFSTVEFQYEGEKYVLQLEPVGPNWNRNQESADGIVQDYVFRPTGEQPGSDKDVNNPHNWYGLTVKLSWTSWLQDVGKAPPTIPDGTRLVFTLKPTVAKTVDGKPAETLTLERAYDGQWKMAAALHDLPIAHYELTGEAEMPGGRKRILFATAYAKYAPNLTVRAMPDLTMRNAYAQHVYFHTEE